SVNELRQELLQLSFVRTCTREATGQVTIDRPLPPAGTSTGAMPRELNERSIGWVQRILRSFSSRGIAPVEVPAGGSGRKYRLGPAATRFAADTPPLGSTSTRTFTLIFPWIVSRALRGTCGRTWLT